MARMNAKIKMGYYPTPSHLIPLIAKYVKKGKELSILDPCCGEGDALLSLGENLGLSKENLFGVELDSLRYIKAKSKIKNVVFGDSTTELRATNGGFSILYENPPYDFDIDEASKRTEYRFLQAHYRYLSPGGVLIYVVPDYILARKEFVKALPFWFKNIKVFKFPQKDYEVYKQVVLFGVKDKRKDEDEERRYLESIKKPLTLGDEIDFKYNPTPVYPKLFTSRNITQEDIKNFEKHSIVKEQLDAFINEKKERIGIKSLMPLRVGHQALLLSSGIMDGVYKFQDRLVVVKGDVERKQFHIDTEEEEKIIYKPIPIIKVLDLDSSEEEKNLVVYDLQ